MFYLPKHFPSKCSVIEWASELFGKCRLHRVCSSVPELIFSIFVPKIMQKYIAFDIGLFEKAQLNKCRRHS